MSAASETSHASLGRPALASTSSDEPTLTTMRRKSARAGVLVDLVREGFDAKVRAKGCSIADFRLPGGGLGATPGGGGAARAVDDFEERPLGLDHALTGLRRQQQRRLLAGALQPRSLLLDDLRGESIDLGQRYDLVLILKPLAVGFELGSHGLVGLAGMLTGAVDEMQQHAAALDVSEETVAEAGAFVGALDQAWDVGQHEFPAIALDHTELRIERGERIVGDLRLGRAHRGKECRLAGVRQSDEAGVGDELEAEPDPALLARLSGIGVPRRTVGRRLEMRVAETAVAALGQHDTLADLGKVGDHRFLVLVENLRSDRHLEHDVFAAGAVAVLAHAAYAGAGFEVLRVAVVDQGVEPVNRLDHDVTAPAAIAAARAAVLDELLAPERDAAVAAVAGANKDLGFVEEFNGVYIGARGRCVICIVARAVDAVLQ